MGSGTGSGAPPLDTCFELWNAADGAERRAAARAANTNGAFVEPYQLGYDGPRGCAFHFGNGLVFNAVLVDGGVEWSQRAPNKRGPVRIPGPENAIVAEDGCLRLCGARG